MHQCTLNMFNDVILRCLRHTRLLSSSENDFQLAKRWLESLDVSSVPLKMFTFRYDRSSGPGGQNVNKINSKCTLMLHNVSECSWLPSEVRKQLLSKPFRYYAKTGDAVVIQSDETRSREKNKQACVAKLVNEVKNTCWFPNEVSESTLKKWDNIKKIADKDRVRQKKINGERKKLRGKIDFKY